MILPRSSTRGERGSATVSIALAVTLALFLVAIVGLWIQAIVLQVQAQRAADLGALAAADAHRGLTGHAPCAIAGQLVSHNGAELTSCQLGDRSATVTVQLWWLRAVSRAGDVALLRQSQ
ncbi:Rv3654c family TadE-like protein [Micrococcoides hystricis]|uniref:Rv3654c family TadE-like protein n=1 Tax=Micrococcoides hystricis TaxID=1572761 RepID=A0ABV6PD58_9MICC